jgi:hypothetical protein
LKGVIVSLLDAKRRSRKRFHLAVNFQAEPSLCADHPFAVCWVPQREWELLELTRQLFGELLQRAPDGLREPIIAWSEEWERCNAIPLLGRHRRHRAELRNLAREVMRHLGEPNPGNTKL